MGKFDKQLAHWREQYRVAVEDLQDLDSGKKKKMAEDTGQGWVDTTDRWKERVRNEVVVFAQLVQVYESSTHEVVKADSAKHVQITQLQPNGF